jgi:subtilase family serine protease
MIGERPPIAAAYAAWGIVLAAAVLGATLAPTAHAGGLGFSLTPSRTEPYAVCPQATPGHSACTAILVPTALGRSVTAPPQSASPALAGPAYTGSGVGGGYDPADLRSAYGLPSESQGSGQTVAIVDAYNDPNAESDLGVYRSRYGLPACTTTDGCFKKVNQHGETTNLPESEPGWSVEISLDIDMVSAACPNCHILLVEASSNENTNLYASEDEAVALGATEVSNSFAGEEQSGETSEDKYFDHPGVPIFASAGDDGYKVSYPAASQYVIAVGGTALTQASNSRGWTESVWGETKERGTGSGCSAYEPKPAWQMASPKCAKRTDNDIAAVASPETPVSIADSYKLPSEFSKPEPGWTLVAGTSVSSPLMAGTMALANAHTRSFAGAEAYYTEASQNGTGVLTDVTSGSNGSCGTYLCNGEVGYDGPTGLGSPYGAPVVLPSPPTVVTKAASSVGQATATLNATVNPNSGEVGKCEFEYGETNSYGKVASCVSLPGSGSSPVEVSASLTGLAANTTYHFRISATNAGGTSKGSDETFKTSRCTAEGYCASFTPNDIEGSFREAKAVAVDQSGDIFVADSGHDRVVEFNSAHAYLRQFGSEGTGLRQRARRGVLPRGSLAEELRHPGHRER